LRPVLVTGWRLGDENRRGRFDKISGRNFGRRRAATLTEPPLDGAKPGGERQSSPLQLKRDCLEFSEFESQSVNILFIEINKF
jgi:hypothetical protein